LLIKIGLEETSHDWWEERRALKNKYIQWGERDCGSYANANFKNKLSLVRIKKKHYDDWFNTNVISQNKRVITVFTLPSRWGILWNFRQLADKLGLRRRWCWGNNQSNISAKRPNHHYRIF
jgi:hypothetical protein